MLELLATRSASGFETLVHETRQVLNLDFTSQIVYVVEHSLEFFRSILGMRKILGANINDFLRRVCDC